MFEARSLITNFETLLCQPNLLNLFPWITLPHNQQSLTCRIVRARVTIPVSLLPLCSEMLSSWKSQCKVLKAREGPEHRLSHVSALNLMWALRCPDGFLASGAPSSEICWNIYALSLFPMWSGGVHAGLGSGAGTCWPHSTETFQRRGHL